MAADVDVAIKAARKAFETTWGTNTPGFERGKLLIKIAELIERDRDILASIEALDNGKTFGAAKGFDVTEAAATFRYYGGWADKIHGKTIEVSLGLLRVRDVDSCQTSKNKFAYTLHEPVGVCGQISGFVALHP